MNEMTNSHILVQEFEYVEPTSVREAIGLLSQYGDSARVLAGGTDLIVQLKMERTTPECLIGIGKIPGLDGIALLDGALHIGARTTIRSIRNEPQVRARFPALADACSAFSSTQVQVMGTIGGNLCNGSPASDAAPALIAFGAEAVITGVNGEKRLPIDALFLGPGRTALRGGQLLTSIVVPHPQPGTGSAFLKVSRVAADIAKVNAAAVIVRKDQRIVDCRLAFGSVSPTPMRARNAENLLSGQVFGAALVADAARVASEEVAPIEDVRSTAPYRHEIVRVLAHDVLHSAWQRAAQLCTAVLPRIQAPVHITAAGLEVGPSTTLRVQATQKQRIELTVNGEKHPLWVMPNDLLLNVLREELQLTGTKYACGIGECGACTVLMDGRPVLSCLVLAVTANGSHVVTVEGLQGPNRKLDPLQEAFIQHGAIQCGYCTPGMLMTAKSLLGENASPSEDDVRDCLKGNLCRCTGYASIVRAVMSCSQQ